MKSTPALRLVSAIPPPAASSQPAQATLPTPTRRRWLVEATRPIVAGPIVVACASLLTWSLAVRLPPTLKPLPLFARGVHAVFAKPAEVIDTPIEDLRAEADLGSKTLIGGRDEFIALLGTLETEAQRLGWKIDWTVRPPIDNPVGFSELTVFPAVAQLEAPGRKTSALYPALIEWLRSIQNLGKRIDVVGLAVDCDDAGVTVVRADVQFTSRAAHEKSSPK